MQQIQKCFITLQKAQDEVFKRCKRFVCFCGGPWRCKWEASRTQQLHAHSFCRVALSIISQISLFSTDRVMRLTVKKITVATRVPVWVQRRLRSVLINISQPLQTLSWKKVLNVWICCKLLLISWLIKW